MPDTPDPPVLAELLSAVRAALADPGDQAGALYDVADAVDAALLVAWERATGTPAERFAVALQAAGELLDALGLALAEGAPDSCTPSPAPPEPGPAQGDA
jgi:hypothetical protein